jgi:DNA polymerase-3 subunit beta
LSVDDVRRAIHAVEKAVPTRSPKPILTNVLVGNGVMIGTDLEIRVEAPLPGMDDVTLLPFGRLQSIVGNITAEEMTFQIDGDHCRISAGKGSWTLPTEDAAEFPAVADAYTRPIAHLPADQLCGLLRPILCVPAKQGYGMGGIQVEFRDGTLYFVATDGKRMAVTECDIDQATDDAAALIPQRAMEIVRRVAATGESVQFETTGSEVVVTVDSTVVRATLLAGQFPKWSLVEPDHDGPHSFANADDLLRACSMAAVCTSETSKGIRWTVADTGITLRSKSQEYGESEVTCGLLEAGTPGSFVINPHYAIEWLNKIDGAETVSIEFKNGDSAMLLRADTARITIMPLADA